MSYTRYDYRKKKNFNFLGYILIIILAIGIGAGVFKFILPKGANMLNVIKEQDNDMQAVNATSNTVFGIIQCGVYGNEESANSILNNIPSNFEKAIVKSDDKYKVIAGIYSLDEIDDKSNELTQQGIENFSIKYSFNNNNVEHQVIDKIVEAYVNIMNIVNEQDVEKYNTSEFKKWTKSIAENCPNKGEDLINLLENVNNLPEEYTKENIKETLNYLYNFLGKYKV